MKIDNKKFEKYRPSTLEVEEGFILKNSIIEELDLSFIDFGGPVEIQKCVIGKLEIHSCWFKNGVIFENNIVSSYVNYEMGGHNMKPVIIKGNIFEGFVSFFDCQFTERVEIHKNIFHHGSNLLGNLNEGFANTFENDVSILSNIGDLGMNG